MPTRCSRRRLRPARGTPRRRPRWIAERRVGGDYDDGDGIARRRMMTTRPARARDGARRRPPNPARARRRDAPGRRRRARRAPRRVERSSEGGALATLARAETRRRARARRDPREEGSLPRAPTFYFSPCANDPSARGSDERARRDAGDRRRATERRARRAGDRGRVGRAATREDGRAGGQCGARQIPPRATHGDRAGHRQGADGEIEEMRRRRPWNDGSNVAIRLHSADAIFLIFFFFTFTVTVSLLSLFAASVDRRSPR